jgi:hypothetical protein
MKPDRSGLFRFLCLALSLMAVTVHGQNETPLISLADPQPLSANVIRVGQTLDFLGAPLNEQLNKELQIAAQARDVVRWAKDRRPGDGRTTVADVPAVQLRLGRLDAALRTARIVVLDAAGRWDRAIADAAAGEGGEVPRDAAAQAAADLGLAKLVATQAAVSATDDALRIAGGPGFLAGRLERAFRDARAGLINPPLEDVALTGFGRAIVDGLRS